MVFPREAPRAVEVMTAAAAAASSSSPSLPPHRGPVLLRGKPRSRLPIPALKPWSNHPFTRCVDDGAGAANAGANGVPSSPAAPPTSSPPAPAERRRSQGPGDDSLEQVRARLMDHLRQAAGRIELPAASALAGEDTQRKGEPAAEAPVVEAEADGDESHAAVAVAATVSVAAAPSSAAEELPWNLRTRKPAPTSNGHHHHHPANPDPPLPQRKAALRLRSGAPERRESSLRRRRPRFSVPLTKEEIDEDVYGFTGRLAARRPKKRPRALQQQLDMLFPGLYLSEVTADMYQVADPPPPPPS